MRQSSRQQKILAALLAAPGGLTLKEVARAAWPDKEISRTSVYHNIVDLNKTLTDQRVASLDARYRLMDRAVAKGHCRSTAALSERIENNIIPVPECGCWIWMGCCLPFGHGQINYRDKRLLAHRASWLAFRGKIKRGLRVLHTCDIPQCVNPDHLYLGTAADNTRDMMRRGRNRYAAGKLTEVDAIAIKRSHEPWKVLAKRHGVTIASISAIKGGRSWARAA